MYLNAKRVASIAMWKQSAGVAGATDNRGAFTVATPNCLEQIRLFSVLVGNPVRRSTALYVDDMSGQFSHNCQADRFLFQRQRQDRMYQSIQSGRQSSRRLQRTRRRFRLRPEIVLTPKLLCRDSS
jgi:hypothetical protein